MTSQARKSQEDNILVVVMMILAGRPAFVISSALWPWDFETQDIDDIDVEEKALRT